MQLHLVVDVKWYLIWPQFGLGWTTNWNLSHVQDNTRAKHSCNSLLVSWYIQTRSWGMIQSCGWILTSTKTKWCGKHAYGIILMSTTIFVIVVPSPTLEENLSIAIHGAKKAINKLLWLSTESPWLQIFGYLTIRTLWLTTKMLYLCILSPWATVMKSQQTVVMDKLSSSAMSCQSLMLTWNS